MRRIVVLLLLIPTLSPAQERAAPSVGLSSLLPADTLFLFEYDDLGGKQGWLRNTALGRIVAEPDMQAFLKPMGESIKKALERIAQQFNPLAAIGLKVEDFKGIAIRRFGLALVNASFAAATPDIDAVLRIEFRTGGANAMKIAGKLKLAAEQHMEVAFEKQELLGKTVWRASARGHEIFAHVDETQILLTSKLPRMKQVLSGTLKTSLAKSERFMTLIKRMGATRRGTLLFANVPPLYDRMLNLVRTHEGPDDAAETEEICKALGLDAVQACAMADIPAGTGFRTEFAVTMSARRGMFTTIGTERVKHLFTQHVPEGAMIYGAEANDLEAYFRNLQRMMMRFEPQGSKEIEDGWKELDALLGVDLRKDLLAALGTQWATYISAPPAGGLIPDFCVFVNIRDRATLEASLDKMVKRIAGLAKEGGLTVVPRETFYRTGRIRFLELSHKGKPVPVAPAWAFGDGYLIVAPFPQSIKGAWADKPSIEKKEDFRALLRQIPDSSVSCTYVDTKRLFGWLYNTGVPLLQGFQGAANVRLEPTGIRLNFEDLPPAEVIQKHLRGLMFYTAVEDDCVRMGYVSDFGAPLVLVPLAAGFALGLAMISAVDRLEAAPPVPPAAPAKKAKKKEAVWHKEADQRLTALEAEIARTKAQLQEAKVDALRVTGELGARALAEAIDARPVDGPARGRILRIEKGLVTINLGTRQGVRAGQQLHLKRGGRYVGPIIIVSTSQDRARGRFDAEWAPDNMSPRAQDWLLADSRFTLARVVAVKDKEVRISMGAKQQVRLGDRYVVTDQGRRLAAVKVTRVETNHAVAVVEKILFGGIRLGTGQDVRDEAFDARILKQIPAANHPSRSRLAPDGLVLSIKNTAVGTFVAVSVGAKDGVRVGHVYHLARAGKFVGRIAIIRVSGDSAYGRIDDTWNGPGFPPKANDRALMHRTEAKRK